MIPTPAGVQLLGAVTPAFAEIPTLMRSLSSRSCNALSAVAGRNVLQRRQDRQAALDRGETLDFLPETKSIREGDWTCAPIPADIQDRRVEITGPTGSQDGDQRAEFGRKDFHGGL